MTRAEAIKVIAANMHKQYPQAWVDNFVALGMLTLDEPKSIEQRTIEALKGTVVGGAMGHSLEKSDVYLIMGWLQNYGLRIVEK